MCFSNCFSCAIQDLHLFILYHECADGTMPSTLPVLRTIPPTLRTIPPNRPKWVHFCRVLPHSAKKSPFPGIKKAGRERTLSGQMTPILHFIPSEGALLSMQPYILTPYQSKHAKNDHPSFVSKLGWLYGTSNGNRTHDFALRGQRLDRLTMEANQPFG